MRAPALVALLLLIAGILLASYLGISTIVYLVLAGIAAVVALVAAIGGRKLVATIAVATALIAAGGYLTRIDLTEYPVNHISRFTALSGRVSIVGTVVSEPDIRPTKTYLSVAAESLSFRGRTIAVSGEIRVRIAEASNAFNFRDQVAFTGFLNAPPEARNPGAFDYRRFLEIRGQHAICNLGSDDRIELRRSGAGEPLIRSLVSPLRTYIAEVFDRYLTPQHSALLRGFLIGDTRYIPKDIYNRFKDTGTLHVLAASGSNVGYVTIVLMFITQSLRIRRPYRYIPAIIGVIIFSFLAYNQPSVVRASVMAVVALVGLILHREANWLNSISVAALLILALRPLYIFDLGMQLSFAATFALILFMPTFTPLLPQGDGWIARALRYLLLIVFGSVVAQLGVMPILLYNFHSVPLVSFLANIVVVPLVGFVATLGIALILISPITFLAALLGAALNLTVGALLAGLNFFNTLPISPLQMGAPALLAIILYYLLLQLAFAVANRSKHAVAFVWLVVVAANLVVWKDVAAGSSAGTQITILDTFQSPTVIVERNSGEATLINGGGSAAGFDRGEMVVLPYLRYRGIDRIDTLILTSRTVDNCNSARTVLEAVQPQDSLRWTGWLDPTAPESGNFAITIDSVRIAFVTDRSAVQESNRALQSVEILAVDWKLLGEAELDRLIGSFHPGTIVVVNYYSRYANRGPLEQLRSRYPQIKIWSVQEIGALRIDIESGRYRVSAAAHSDS